MTTSPPRVPLRRALLTFVVATAALCFCASARAASTLPTVSVAATPTSATIGGALQSGGVNVVMTSSAKETTVILVALKPGVSLAEAEAFAKSSKPKDPNNVGEIGSIVFDAEANPGPPSEVQTELKAGDYLLLTGVGEGEPTVKAHFTVTASKAPVALPVPGATVRAIDFNFRGPSVLHVGELVRFENEGFVVHMQFAFPVRNLKSARKVVGLLREGKERPLRKLIVGPPVGFAGPLSHGAFQQETITARPGVYVEVCFMQTQDGRDHTRIGMERIIRIAK
ncbi:MAG: hypothetical protein QOF54_1494 [Solirubrobacteraceae bacterium]|nr:hypothetical protein [Solirubrobacteraceae bacterium]